MKLYTEEQIRILLDKMNVFYSLEDLTPIELPTDEEIETNGVKQWDGYKQSNYLSAFTVGAKWMRDKILNK